MKPRASQISVDPSGLAVITGTDVQTALGELDAGLAGTSYTDEQVRDVVGAALVAGSNVTITVNDPGDTITIAASGGGGSGPTWNVVSRTSGYTAAAGDAIVCNTSGGAFTITLPTSPTTGSTVMVTKIGTDTNLVTISGAANIGPYSNVKLKYPTDSLTFIYTGSKWEVYAQVGQQYVRLPTLSILQSGTYGDTFDTGSLDAKWTRVGFTSSDETYQVGTGSSEMQIAGRGAGNYYYQAAPAGDFDVIWAGEIYASAALMFGPIIVDNTGFGVAAGYYNSSPNGPLVGTVSSGAYDGAFQAGPTPPLGSTAMDGTTKTWIRLRKVGTAYSVAVSTDGEAWLTASSTISRSFTPTRVGFGPWYSTGMTNCKVDVFDVR